GVVALLAGRWESRMGYRRRRVVIVGLVAADARRIRNVVVVVDVAIRARARRPHMSPPPRNPRFCVLAPLSVPARSIMARIAGLREALRNMVGVRRPLKIFEVARNASVRAQGVIVVYVTVRASSRRHCMHASQWEINRVVVEARRRPACRRVAGSTRRGEVQRYVVWIGSALEIAQVATYASRIR